MNLSPALFRQARGRPVGSRSDLAPAAIARSANDLRARAEAEFSGSELRRSVEETFAWLRTRLAGVLADAWSQGELDTSLDPAGAGGCFGAGFVAGYVSGSAWPAAPPSARHRPR
ncbi:hypothetical protein [Sphaerisporangium fuscum]|uniref:hypothetical protein n=1 Tax=Sphaerisporangium fuscum TaxID=2835868 RepID=UPI001BDD25C1|nr:hypothetical protein [Sphaerisporangium fuscum]